jgi:hypothetical protein
MSTLVSEQKVAIQNATVTAESLSVDLTDGRTMSVPLAWFPRLVHGTSDERSHWELIGRGVGIHWPDLDEDISLEGILAGRASGESQESLRKWLAARAR